MDRRERIQDMQEVLRSMRDAQQSELWTALPGIVQSFDNANMTCVVQPSIMVQVFRPQTRSWVSVRLPLLLDVPVIFPSGGGFTLTFPISPGDEGLVHFASRCIDSWWQSGGIQPQAELRFHDLSDGFIQVGIRSQVRVLPAVSTNSVQLRSDSGTCYIEMTGAGAVNVVAPGGFNVTAPTSTFNGEVIATGEGTLNGIPVSTHTHGGVEPGGGQTGEPVA